MANEDYTKYDEALLSACKHYIRITQNTPEMLIIDLCGKAEDYCQSLPGNILELIAEKNKAEKINHKGET